jgi:hypothetical protein
MPIKTDGAVTTGTKANLIEGVRSSAMASVAVDAVLEQAAEFTQLLVDTYSRQVASGEVGEGGTGRATEDAILANRPPRALLYGRIQSGKTVSMILTSALCLDNGFRIVVVLTTDNVALVKQTAGRFKDLDGPRVFAGLKEGPSYEWEGQEEALRSSLASEGLVLVCSKNGFNLPEVIHFLSQLDAATYPVLVLDDEADAATPDTTQAARTSDRPNAPVYASKINRLIVANDHPDEVGFSLGEQLPHSLYVQVTATPYILLLQTASADLRPTISFLLEPGEGYCGGEVFFADFDPEKPDSERPKNLFLVGANEGASMKRAAPPGLAKSINFFILSACALSQANGAKGWPREGFKHLSHTSHRTDEHEVVAGYIAAHLNDVREKVRAGNEDMLAFFAEAHEELARSIDPCPPLQGLLASVRAAMKNADVHRINSKADAPEYSPRLNFLVGGNILGRGLTIDDLLVTYYVREAKTSQMDTVWQHARMFGYRRSYLDYIRIFLPKQLAARFRQIHEAEEGLRRRLADGDETSTVLIKVPTSSRPTRPNALETGAVRTVDAGRDQVFPHLLHVDQEAARLVLGILQANDVPIGSGDRESRATTISLPVLNTLIENVAVRDDDPGLWDPTTISALLANYQDQLQNGATVYVREVGDQIDTTVGWWRGRLNGVEIQLLRDASPQAPALALLYNGDAADPRAWYPTLVMPAGSPTFVFSGE